MRTLLALVVPALAAATLAQDQDPLLQARARLQKALAATAAQPSGAFDARWGPPPRPQAQQQGANVMVMVSSGMAGADEPGQGSGVWSPDRLHLTYDDGAELVFAGRVMLARDADTAWCLRRDLRADGSRRPFVPDLPLLLRQLARMDLAVVHQEVGSRNDRPVEILTATLTADQATELLWGGLLPRPGGNLGAMMFRAAAGAGAPKPVVPRPEATIDVAVVLDPATAAVHAITCRIHQKQDQGMGAARVVFAGPGGVQVGGTDDEDEEDEADAKAKAQQPLQFKDGLPQRPRKKMTIWDYAVELKQLGSARPPELPAEAKALLGAQ